MKDGQTIGEWLNWDFKANGDLEIYRENSDGETTDNRFPEIIEHNGRKYQLIP